LFWQSSSPDAGSFLGFLPEGSDKVIHAGAYAVLAALATLATGNPVVGASLAVLYGVTDEVHQSFVPGRFPSVGDLVADAIGAALGSGLVAYLVLRSKRAPVE
jgi:VanZ family protein